MPTRTHEQSCDRVFQLFGITAHEPINSRLTVDELRAAVQRYPSIRKNKAAFCDIVFNKNLPNLQDKTGYALLQALVKVSTQCVTNAHEAWRRNNPADYARAKAAHEARRAKAAHEVHAAKKRKLNTALVQRNTT